MALLQLSKKNCVKNQVHGVMDAKKALVETDGDMEKAIEIAS